MKKIMISLLLITAFNNSWAQENKVSHYLLKGYELGTIDFKSGNDLKKELNYNRLTNEMVFLQDGKPMAVFETEKIDTITINGRKFIPDNDRFLEVIQAKSNLLYMAHTASIIPPAASAGMGSTSQTSGQTAMANVKLITGVYSLTMPDNKVVLRDEIFFKADNSFQRFNSRTFDMAFPGKGDEIKKLIKSNKIDLEKSEDVSKLLSLL